MLDNLFFSLYFPIFGDFGGVLTIIFLLVFLLFVILYLFDYYEKVYTLNNAYEIQYLHLIDKSLDIDQGAKDSDQYSNPNKSFWVYLYLDLYDRENSSLSNNFELWQTGYSGDGYIKKIQKENEGFYIITGKLSDITLQLIYNCPYSNCTIREEDKKDYYFEIQWLVPTLSYQNPSFPVDENNLILNYIRKPFSIHHHHIIYYYWEKNNL